MEFLVITGPANMANIAKMAIMAAMECLFPAINMADIGVYAELSKNVDQ